MQFEDQKNRDCSKQRLTTSSFAKLQIYEDNNANPDVAMMMNNALHIYAIFGLFPFSLEALLVPIMMTNKGT